jgi:tetratricopeptide (TPR) repeat protein
MADEGLEDQTGNDQAVRTMVRFSLTLRLSRLALIGLALSAPALPSARSAAAEEVQSFDSLFFGGQRSEGARRYDACLALARTEPIAAVDAALAWQTQGGGIAAEHCLAVSLIELDQFTEAARRLEDLAQRGDPAIRTTLLAQAGVAWHSAGELDRAYAVQTSAIELAPGDVGLWIDRGFTLAEANHFQEAIDDLSRAHDLAPERADILAWRASAYRYLGASDRAWNDVERALELDPTRVEARLERGIQRRLKGDDDGARQDWISVITTAPGSPSADAAQRNLELLDFDAQ